jgi:hypothetical protein
MYVISLVEYARCMSDRDLPRFAVLEVDVINANAIIAHHFQASTRSKSVEELAINVRMW